MTRMTHRALALALTAAMLLPVTTTAQAGDGWGPRGGLDWGSDWDNDYRHRPHNPERRKKRDNTDAALAAGVIGLAAGAILFGALGSSSNAAPPPPAYYPPVPAYGGPVYGAPVHGGPVYGGPAYGGSGYGSPVYAGPVHGSGMRPIPQPGVPVDDRPIIAHGGAGVGYQPWSPAWYDYCRARYRSFNPQTGTFTTYSGEKRFCQ